MGIAAYIDHTLLKPNATSTEIVKLCEEAEKFGFHGVCVNPAWVSLAKRELEKTKVKICTTLGFPLGSNLSESKVFEAMKALEQGADEFDMVINIPAVLESRWKEVEKDISDVVEIVESRCVKVILETGFLTDEQIVQSCKIAEHAGASFVKTSTGFGPRGATQKDVKIMRESVSDYMGVKAAGGIKDLKRATAMINAGATRLGTSASVDIVQGQII